MKLATNTRYGSGWELLKGFQDQRLKVKVLARPDAPFRRRVSCQLITVRPLCVRRMGYSKEN